MRMAHARTAAADRGAMSSIKSCLLMMATIIPATHGSIFSPNAIPTPALETDALGRMGIAGDFAGLSLYQFEGQTEQSPSTNGADSLMSSLPNGLFHSIASTDATVQAMCTFKGSAIIAGNFTSVNSTESPAVVALDLSTGAVTPLAGISGSVTSMFCDEDEGMVYVGGNFRALDSTNAITWLAKGNWASLPFAGFNGPVSSITKATNGHIIFGGKFSGLGNTSTTAQADAESINLSSAVVQGFQSTTAPGFSDAENVICNTAGATGAGKSWLLLDGTPGAWRAEFGFEFTPTKLRLRNTRQPDRGVKTWRLTALPLNGIMNFTYIDPGTGQNRSCSSECPLSNDSTVPFQDFHFVNPIGMSIVRIDISAWYGKGAGLDGIELFDDALIAHAINDFNTAACSNTTTPAKATTTGPWQVTASGQSKSKYLSATLSETEFNGTEVIFYPPIAETGNYTAVMYTPGCIVDGTCLQRGQVEITSQLKANQPPTTTILYQTNNFDKYDQIAFGDADPVSDSFRPSVTLKPLSGQTLQLGAADMVVVAQAVAFWLTNSTSSGLNGLFEYDPTQATINDADVQKSEFVKLASTFDKSAAISALTLPVGDLTYIGGNFSSDKIHNVAALNTQDGSEPVSVGGGLNGAVTALFHSGDDGKIYAGGAFVRTQDGSITNLNRIAVYDTSAKTWAPLGAGVDGLVTKIVPMVFNMSGISEEVITLSGNFQKLLAFGDNAEAQVDGFAVWVKSQGRWLQNAQGAVPLLQGSLSASLLGLANNTSLYAGSLSAQALRANGIASMTSSIGSFPIDILANTSTSAGSLSRRASIVDTVDDVYGVMAGTFYKNDGSNITILGGHFTAEAANGSRIQNLAFIDGANSDAASGLPQGISTDSVFLALATQGENLFAGGKINGTVSGSAVTGVISYNMNSKIYNKQPPALVGDEVVVSSILNRPDTTDIYVGGTFTSAGSLPCPAVCVFSTTTNQWSRPGFFLEGQTRAMTWSSNSVLVAGGQLSINDTTQYLASFDTGTSVWSLLSGSSSIPGPVDALTIATADGSQLWIAGAETAEKSFLMKHDGQSFIAAPVSFQNGTIIQSLQMFTLAQDHTHDDTATLPDNQVLMLTGSIGIPGFGTASVALFDGKSLKPYILSTNANGRAGHVSRFFVENPLGFFETSEGGMALGFIVLIALAISLALMLIIVVAGFLLDRYRKKREGYIPAPTSMLDRGNGMQRIPPHELLDSLNKGRPGAPHV